MRDITVLIVDDEPAILASISKVLSPYYQVLAANSGSRALLVAASETRPDLILLDVLMPEMDGYAVLNRLKADPATRDIPVIFVTVTESAEDETKGLELGAVDYITKPINPSILLARVKAQLMLKQARDFLHDKNDYLEAELARRIKTLDEAHDQLLQSEKMAAIGQLTAGVAHEINNPVGYVNSNLNTLNDYIGDIFQFVDACVQLEGSDLEEIRQRIADQYKHLDIDYLKEDLSSIIKESSEGLRRVKEIVHNLKDFSRIDKVDREEIDLHQCLDSTINIVWNELKYHVELVKEYGELPLVTCRPSQLGQVFLNLLVNASHAIEGKGTITLRTGTQGSDVWVEVTDNGKGIDTEHLNRIFDPFFTTKKVGKGTGLGLSIAYGIVEKHQGQIEVSSEVGKGSSFRVTIPIHPNVDTEDDE
ncbi:MAG: ATP-binding protein [Motiliproteus sp.]